MLSPQGGESIPDALQFGGGIFGRREEIVEQRGEGRGPFVQKTRGVERFDGAE